MISKFTVKILFVIIAISYQDYMAQLFQIGVTSSYGFETAKCNGQYVYQIDTLTFAEPSIIGANSYHSRFYTLLSPTLTYNTEKRSKFIVTIRIGKKRPAIQDREFIWSTAFAEMNSTGLIGNNSSTVGKYNFMPFQSFSFYYEYLLKTKKRAEINLFVGLDFNNKLKFESKHISDVYKKSSVDIDEVLNTEIAINQDFGSKHISNQRMIPAFAYGLLFKYNSLSIGLRYSRSLLDLEKGDGFILKSKSIGIDLRYNLISKNTNTKIQEYFKHRGIYSEKQVDRIKLLIGLNYTFGVILNGQQTYSDFNLYIPTILNINTKPMISDFPSLGLSYSHSFNTVNEIECLFSNNTTSYIFQNQRLLLQDINNDGFIDEIRRDYVHKIRTLDLCVLDKLKIISKHHYYLQWLIGLSTNINLNNRSTYNVMKPNRINYSINSGIGLNIKNIAIGLIYCKFIRSIHPNSEDAYLTNKNLFKLQFSVLLFKL